MANVLQEILNELKCVACDQLPAHELWLLGGACTHKYCEVCVLSTKGGKPCLKCPEKAVNPYIDPVTTKLLVHFKKYQDCKISDDGSCNCKKSKAVRVNEINTKVIDEAEVTVIKKVDVENGNTKTTNLMNKTEGETTEPTCLKTPKPQMSVHESDDEQQQHDSRKHKRLVISIPVGEGEITPAPDKRKSDQAYLQERTCRSEPVKVKEHHNPLSRNRPRTSVRRTSDMELEGPEDTDLTDVTPKLGRKKIKSRIREGETTTETKMSRSSIYDLNEGAILKQEKKSMKEAAKLKEKLLKSAKPLSRKSGGGDENQNDDEATTLSDSPPLSLPLPQLTQHGSTPTKRDIEDTSLEIDVGDILSTSTSRQKSPTLPVLSPVTGKPVETETNAQHELKNAGESGELVTPKRPPPARTPVLRTNLKTHVSTSPASTISRTPPSNSGRNKSKSSRTPSVCSDLSSANDSFRSNATTLDSSSTEKCNAKGETKLHIACRVGQLDKVQQLISAGLDINSCDFAGWTPLHEAINSKSTESFDIVKLLCEAGCNINTPGLDNDTPLHECVRTGRIRTIKFLLSYGACTTFRNKAGKLPRDVTDNETIQKILDDFKGPYIREPDATELIKASMKNSTTFFTYEEDKEMSYLYKMELGGKITETFGQEVTHVIFNQDEVIDSKVLFSFNYLAAILTGAWVLSSEWVKDSVEAGKFLDPGKYEIKGCLKNSKFSLDESLANEVPARARTNKEMGNPGLLDGFNIYLYKTSSYQNLKRKDLCSLISIGGGKVVNREPNPDSLDPLDYPPRFHASEPEHKMTITSHIILYDEDNKPPKLQNLEHMKTLRTDWLIESVLHFTILSPDEFL